MTADTTLVPAGMRQQLIVSLVVMQRCCPCSNSSGYTSMLPTQHGACRHKLKPLLQASLYSSNLPNIANQAACCLMRAACCCCCFWLAGWLCGLEAHL
jgi:hypothetical protein